MVEKFSKRLNESILCDFSLFAQLFFCLFFRFFQHLGMSINPYSFMHLFCEWNSVIACSTSEINDDIICSYI